VFEGCRFLFVNLYQLNVDSFDSFSAGLRNDASSFAFQLTSSKSEADVMVDRALQEAYGRYREAGEAATPVWVKCMVLRSLMDTVVEKGGRAGTGRSDL